MRILVIPENYPTDIQPNGGVFMEDQVKSLAQVGEVTVFNTNPWKRGQYRTSGLARYYDFHLFSRKWRAPFNLLAYAWWEFQSFQIAKKLPKPDIIHLHGATLRGKLAVKLAEYWQVALVIAEHTGPWSAISDRPMTFHKAKLAMESADVVMPVSNHLLEEIRRSGIQARRFEVVGNPVDTHFFSLRKTRLDTEKQMLFLGRLDDFKGGLRTLRAFHKMHNELADWKLTIAGEGEESGSIRAYIATHQLESKVEFVEGFFDRATMRDYFHRSSFLIFPSTFESFGLVGAEAMSTGLPVLITDRTGPKDYFVEGCGWQTDPTNIDAIADGMLKLARTIQTFDPDFIRNHIAENFGLEKYAKTVFDIYSGLVSGR